jgi:hypothetical protein
VSVAGNCPATGAIKCRVRSRLGPTVQCEPEHGSAVPGVRGDRNPAEKEKTARDAERSRVFW